MIMISFQDSSNKSGDWRDSEDNRDSGGGEDSRHKKRLEPRDTVVTKESVETARI